MKRVRVVAALISDPVDSTRFLAQQRLATGSRANLWEFPGGKVEAGESDQAALIRECHEELAVEISVGRHLWQVVHEYPDLTVELVLYAASVVSGQPHSLGAQALRFCTPKQMQGMPFCEADVPLLAQLVSGAVATS